MARINQSEDLEKRVGGTTFSPTQTSYNDETDYYEQLKQENYKALLSKEIQLDNARQRALKNTNVQVNALGMGSSGYGMTAQTGIESQYLTALEGAGQDYQAQENVIQQQQRDENLATANDNFQSITTLMGSSSSTAQLNDILSTAGFIDEKGNWTDKLGTLNENDQLQLKTLYNMYNTQLQDNEFISNQTLNGQGFKDFATALNGVITNEGDKGDKIKNELRYLFSDSSMANKPNGYVVKLTSGANDKQYAYMIYRNGSWYQTTSSVYNSADANNKQEIKGK
ncbi:MAG TPA: hypothetical protein PLR16_07210 [Bacilli bacterium]|nr:hypothetical protein [Bacilli bacterium]